jgi:two-component system, OmpR family, sensor kinase
MKLINKFTLWYLCIALATSVVGTAITYYSIKNRMDSAAITRLLTINRLAAEKLQSGQPFDSAILGRKVQVSLLTTPMPAKAFDIAKSESPYPGSQKTEYRITAHSFFTIHGKNYSITSFGYVINAGSLLNELETTAIWKWLFILSLIAVSGRLVSRIILSPFNKTLKVIERFNLKQKEKVRLSATNTREFRELNNFVQAMTDKAVDEYIALKEFTENASHELQTPVAVMGMKLEMLAESAITDEQALLINDMQRSLEKLSRINSSLVLLTRLENHEYSTNESLNFCELINESLDTYKELMEMKSITLSKNVTRGVYVKLHPTLGHLLLNNLISNAIRHNKAGGSISLELTRQTLVIINTGPEPSIPTVELFHRFKKSNQSSESIGIGLAIVKQICDIHHFDIQYTFTNGFHKITIEFAEINEHPFAPPAAQQSETGFQPHVQPAL